MKALTLHRPWAWAIVAAGKDIENRTWKPPASIISRRIAIHAGKTIDPYARQPIASAMGRRPDVQELGDMLDQGIVGTAVVIGFTTAPCSSPWFYGPIGWRLADVIRLQEPAYCRGAQGLWNVPTELERLVMP